MQGVEVRDHNGIRILRLHYTADPDKRAPEWAEEAKRGLPTRDWLREYEVRWDIASGLPVFADEFIREQHISKDALLALPNLPIYRGWDWGLTPACVWCQMDAMGRLNVLAEHVTWDGRGEMVQMGAERFAPEVVRLSNDWFPGAEFIDYADPAGWAKSQADEKTCIRIVNELGIYPRKGPVTFTERRRAIVDSLSRMVGGRPRLMCSNDARMIVEGLAGAYRYEEIGQTSRYKEQPEKNAWSHPIDALSYVVGGLYGTKLPDDAERRTKRRSRDKVTGY